VPAFNFGGALLDRFLGLIPGLRMEGPSNVRLTGELAFSTPNPNTRGAAYLDDFESGDELRIEPRRQQWQLGSRPQSTIGDRGRLPLSLDAGNAAPLVWQHDFLQDGVAKGALLPRDQIDNQINIAGRQVPEAVMWLSFGPAGSGSDPERWRSITQVLSPTGIDLSRSEYIEFYASAGAGVPLALIFDVGVVGEDAFYVDSLGNTAGRYPDNEQWGLGLLDEEAKLAQREVWGTDLDKRGLWDQPCEVDPTVPYPLGDPRANCTRGNGMRDSEDLNGNGILDQDDGQYFRYVVELDKASEYLVRDVAQTGTNYRLYRVPLRGGSGTAVNNASDATWRFVRHLRLTVAGRPAHSPAPSPWRACGSWIALEQARHRGRGAWLAGRRMAWARRAASVRVGPVSQLTDKREVPAPAVRGRADAGPAEQHRGERRRVQREIAADRLPGPGAGRARRAFYHTMPSSRGTSSTYRQLRLWAVARREARGGRRTASGCCSSSAPTRATTTSTRPAEGCHGPSPDRCGRQ
jgi:hypothetical protein